ncbi:MULTISPECIES: DUF2066 domain-containing protein [Shewanella]|uniref:DUF2066 domain-containing protein n=1 Tax=Shewanella TaxID=22 RepID=UPI001EFE9067|nr:MULTISPECIES: DUF2066 domain-containing protein [Shewanella]MCG9746355.1 DUF2066 domain-containing protein [Shewanella sp. Isolate8]MCL2909571.1 DUF2066 domain-containing protein [Shewanella aquimarina]
MFKSFLSVMLAGALCAASLNVAAVEVTELDRSAIKIADRSQQVKNQALRQAMEEVVLKNTGDRMALSEPLVAQAIAQPTAYIRQFGYLEQGGEQYLQASFDHSKIISLLREAKLPVWGKQRPLTLLWLAQENEGKRELLNDASMLESRSQIANLSQTRGVPMLLPMMDLDDAMAISVTDVRGMFADTVAKASQRYGSDYFAMVSLDTLPDELVNIQLALYPTSSDQPLFNPLSTLSTQVKGMDVAVSEIFGAISQYYVARYAIADSGEANSTRLTFVEITDRQQLLDIEKYLHQLSAVKSVSLTKVQGISAEFSLELFGSEEDLYRLISLEPKIRSMEPANGSALLDNPNLLNSQSELGGDEMVDPLSSSQTPRHEYIWQGR